MSEVREAAQRADQLSRVDTETLSDFRYNPAAAEYRQSHLARVHRRQAELEAARELARAEDEHERLVAELARARRWQSAQDARDERAIGHAVRAADDASERHAAIQQARREHSAAEAAGALTRSRKWWTRGYLGFAVAASGVSMVGIAHLFMAGGVGTLGAFATAALVETVLTVLVTYIIAAQAHLSQREGLGRAEDKTRISAQVPRWAARLPWSVVAGLLAVSVLLNGSGVVSGTGVYGVVGMAGAIAAALCSGLAWAHSVATTAVTTAALDDHDIQAGEDELARRASGADIPTGPQAREVTEPAKPQEHREPVALVSGPDAVAEELADLPDAELAVAVDSALSDERTAAVVLDVLAARGLADTPVPDDASGLTGGDDGSGGAAVVAPSPAPSPGPQGAQADPPAEIPDDAVGGDSSAQSAQGTRDRAASARKARKAGVAKRRARARELWDAGRSVAEIAEEMVKDPRTITGYLLDGGVSQEDMAARAGGGPQ